MKKSGIPCSECDSIAYYKFNPGNIQISYKGLQWSDKNYKEKKYRKDRSKKMDYRQKKNNKIPKLAPNFRGDVTKNWKEAHEAAKSDKDCKWSESYIPYVKAEENGDL